MVDRFPRFWGINAVVRRKPPPDRDIRGVGAAHIRMAVNASCPGIQEGDFLSVNLYGYKRADVLGDSARFKGLLHLFSDSIQKGGFTMVNTDPTQITGGLEIAYPSSFSSSSFSNSSMTSTLISFRR